MLDATLAERTVEAPVRLRVPSWVEQNLDLLISLTAGLLLLIAWIGDEWNHLSFGALVVAYGGAYALGGYNLGGHLLREIRERRFQFDIDLLMLLAAAGAAVLGKFAEGAFLLFLFSLAHALEQYALHRARNAIRSLADLFPARAHVFANGAVREIAVEQIRVGDVVVVRPGERVPIDGRIIQGESSLNEAPITGESIPVQKCMGDAVYAGTVNGDGALEVETERTVGDRTLDRVIKLVEEAQTQKAPTQHLTDRFERVFVPLVLITDLLVIVIPPLFGGWDWETSFYRGMTLLVGASPCALALGTPSAVLAGIAQAARSGVLIKGGAHLESLAELGAIAFDKTGTLTIGHPEVTDVVALPGSTESETLLIAASAEQRSQHPLAQAVLAAARERGLTLLDSTELQSVTARGLRARVSGLPVEIGNLRMWEGSEIPAVLEEVVSSLREKGRSVMVVRHGGRWLGALGVADRPRHTSKPVLAALHKLGVGRLMMLTGDHRSVGDAVAGQVGLDEVRAELLPEDKVAEVKDLLKSYGKVGMVGDGVNDAPALATATVGIAMGGVGSGVALESADVVLMGDDLTRLPFGIALARRTAKIIKQNIVIALGVIVFLILAAVSGKIGIGPAVVVHEGSTIVVIMNALRLLRFKSAAECG